MRHNPLMPEFDCDVLIVGGGVGGCAAAMAAASLGVKVILTEEHAWLGGQLTSQAVPPDEHPWIEEFGCTAWYREFRERVRAYYRLHRNLSGEARNDATFNPGSGWVSKLCFEPEIGWTVLKDMLTPAIALGGLTVLTGVRPVAAETSGDRISSVTVSQTKSGVVLPVRARFILDATETGELLHLGGVEHVVGAESQDETVEPHAVSGPPQPDNVQGFTWCFAMGWDPDGDHTIDKPAQYEQWKAYRPSDWPGPMLGWTYPHPITGKPTTLPLLGGERQMGLFDYRQIVSRRSLGEGVEEASIVNWPQNDYFEGNLLTGDPEEAARALDEAKQLSLSLLYWLQTEAPRPDGGVGFPGLRLRPDLTGTKDGFAMAPYIRESRRIKSLFTIKEQHLASELNPGKSVADRFPDSVGVGAYRIDLHPSTSGAGYIDIGSLPFEIPLGALIPQRTRNLVAACKNIGTTHITNGCYRLHPVEWNTGEAAGLLAAYCVLHHTEPQEVHERAARLAEFQSLAVFQGVQLHWPENGVVDGRPVGPL